MKKISDLGAPRTSDDPRRLAVDGFHSGQVRGAHMSVLDNAWMGSAGSIHRTGYTNSIALSEPIAESKPRQVCLSTRPLIQRIMPVECDQNTRR